MIIEFSVQNFGPIKEKQVLSFEPEKSSHLEDYYLIKAAPGLKLLKLGLIYGPNASGKTTILKALDFLRNLVLEPAEKKTNTLNFEPFLLDAKTPAQHTQLSISFIQKNVRYHYVVEFNKKSIVREQLDFYDPKKANVFVRETDIKNQFSTITFGSKLKGMAASEKALTANTLWNNTVLGGFLKTNIECRELQDATDWFKNYLKPIVLPKTNLEDYVTSLIDRAEVNKNHVLQILKNADFNISDIIIDKQKAAVPEGLWEYFVEKGSVSKERIIELKQKETITILNLAFEHTVKNKKYRLPDNAESRGTMRYYGFAGLMSMLINSSKAIPIDELEASLHPDLFVHFLLTFLMNSKKSQIIATTHNREILNNKDIFRNDAIWFTDKSEDSATKLYSLADFDSSVIRDTSNVYNAYKIGKLGAVPDLGDFQLSE